MFVVLSVWASLEHWEAWAGDSFRQKMNERIDGLLSRPSKARVFEDAVYKPTPVARGSNKA